MPPRRLAARRHPAGCVLRCRLSMPLPSRLARVPAEYGLMARILRKVPVRARRYGCEWQSDKSGINNRITDWRQDHVECY
ncbi:hypothetical protein AX27061_1492 [Achromobacter xylosoxidans NBRC 15126 = ATCC 27061]|nr:hypothetical protein AX27061_1492 [Achromobacter xylosoxidans NBRC 15126 = ATCC 27061]